MRPLLVIVFLLAVNVYAQVAGVYQSGLAGHWSFEAKNANDTSGKGYNGTIVRTPTWVTSLFGTAIYLNGIGAGPYIDLGQSTMITGATQFSICVWTIGTTATNGNNVLMEVADSSGNIRWRTRLDYPSVYFETYTNGQFNGTYALGATPSDWKKGVWAHFAFTFGINGAKAIFFNGRSVASAASNPLPLFINSDCGVLIGANNRTTPDHYSIGTYDEILFYTRALSASEIATLALSKPMRD